MRSLPIKDIADKFLHQLVHYKELPLYVFMCHYGMYRRPRAHNTCIQLLLIRHGKDRQRYFVLYHRLSLKVAWTEGKTQADHKSRGDSRNEKVGDQYISYVSDAANPEVCPVKFKVCYTVWGGGEVTQNNIFMLCCEQRLIPSMVYIP